MFIRWVLVISLALVALPSRGAHTILVVGDSLSAAYNIALDEGWISLLGERIASAGCEVSMVNAAITGETTSGGLTRLPKLLDTHQPTIVMLELGGNDGLRGFPMNHLRDNLSSMIRLSREAGAKVLLLGIQIPSNYGRRYTESLAGLYPELKQSFDVPLVPFFLDGVAENPELMQADGIHPNARAQPILVDNVLPDLAPLMDGCSISQNADPGRPYTEPLQPRD